MVPKQGAWRWLSGPDRSAGHRHDAADFLAAGWLLASEGAHSPETVHRTPGASGGLLACFRANLSLACSKALED